MLHTIAETEKRQFTPTTQDKRYFTRRENSNKRGREREAIVREENKEWGAAHGIEEWELNDLFA